jgi:hypothetical protein
MGVAADDVEQDQQQAGQAAHDLDTVVLGGHDRARGERRLIQRDLAHGAPTMASRNSP